VCAPYPATAAGNITTTRIIGLGEDALFGAVPAARAGHSR
jgi:hypothetical protein